MSILLMGFLAKLKEAEGHQLWVGGTEMGVGGGLVSPRDPQ